MRSSSERETSPSSSATPPRPFRQRLERWGATRWGGVVPAAIVAVCTIHVAYSRAAVTDVPLTLGVAVALALMVKGRIELAGIAVGLATGFKYPGLFLIVPLVVAAWGRWARLAAGVALAVVAFLASSPFVLVHR